MRRFIALLCILGTVLCMGCALFTTSSSGTFDPSAESIAEELVLNRIYGTVPIDIPEGMPVEEVWKHARAGAKAYWRNIDKLDVSPDQTMMTIDFRVRQHTLRICYRLEGQQLIPDVPFSTNLKQNGTRIHRNAVRWINNISHRIRAHVNGLIAE